MGTVKLRVPSQGAHTAALDDVTDISYVLWVACDNIVAAGRTFSEDEDIFSDLDKIIMGKVPASRIDTPEVESLMADAIYLKLKEILADAGFKSVEVDLEKKQKP